MGKTRRPVIYLTYLAGIEFQSLHPGNPGGKTRNASILRDI